MFREMDKEERLLLIEAIFSLFLSYAFIIAFVVIVLIGCSATVSKAEPSPIPVDIYKMTSSSVTQQLNNDEVYAAFINCKQQWDKTFKNRPLRLASYNEVTEFPGDNMLLSLFETYYADAIFYLYKNGGKAKHISLMVYPALHDSSPKIYFGGLATLALYYKRITAALIFAARYSWLGDDRLATSAWMICHEIGHNVGMNHSLEGIMVATLIDGNNPPTFFSYTSQAEFKRYMRRIGR